MNRNEPDLHLETLFQSEGKKLIVGLDEVGRGALAGPVVAGAVILPIDDGSLTNKLEGVRDSKQCTSRQRERLDIVIRAAALAVSIGLATADEIDRIGIAPATRLAMTRALDQLPITPDALLIDYVRLTAISIPQRSFPKGDQRSLSIAAASIIAKVARDAMMVAVHDQFPDYDFARNKGYGTAEHMDAVSRHGPCRIHRLSFSPFRPPLIPELHENSART